MDDPSPPPTLLDVPPAVIGKTARYLDIFEDGLMGLCVLLGRNAANSIRYAYLKDNVKYLHYFDNLISHLTDSDNTRMKDEFSEDARDMLRQWMEVNVGWREACKPYSNGESGISGVFEDAVLNEIVTDEDEGLLDDNIGFIGTDNFDIKDLLVTRLISRESNPTVEYVPSVVVGVDGVDASMLPNEEVEEILLRRGSKKRLRLMDTAFAYIFLNPSVAIDLGLLELLQFQIKDLGVNVNSQEFLGIKFQRSMPLIVHALAKPDSSLFQYLLSVEGIEFNPVLKYDEDGDDMSESRCTLLHRIHRIAKRDLGGKLDIHRIEALIRQRGVELEVRDFFNDTPLICIAKASNEMKKIDYELVKVYLEAGAEPGESFILISHQLAIGGRNRRGYQGKVIKLLETAMDQTTMITRSGNRYYRTDL